MIPDDIEAGLKSTTEKARDTALEMLAQHGLVIGAEVERLDWRKRTPTGEIYRVTRFGCGYQADSIWPYGNKLRRDGTWGTHVHCIAAPSCVQVLVTRSPMRTNGGDDA